MQDHELSSLISEIPKLTKKLKQHEDSNETIEIEIHRLQMEYNEAQGKTKGLQRANRLQMLETKKLAHHNHETLLVIRKTEVLIKNFNAKQEDDCINAVTPDQMEALLKNLKEERMNVEHEIEKVLLKQQQLQMGCKDKQSKHKKFVDLCHARQDKLMQKVEELLN